MLAHGRLKSAQSFDSTRELAMRVVHGSPSVDLMVLDPIGPLYDEDLCMLSADPASAGWAKVAAYSSEPWGGRMGLLVAAPRDEARGVYWGHWRLDEPSPSQGSSFPFFRLGDLEDASALLARVLAVFVDHEEARGALWSVAHPKDGGAVDKYSSNMLGLSDMEGKQDARAIAGAALSSWEAQSIALSTAMPARAFSGHQADSKRI
jgi:hypothetical protein